MSTIIFSEGKHDLEFLKLLHKYNRGSDYDTFNAQLATESQSTRIRQHQVGDQIDYLYKSEGGKSEVIKQFRTIATEIDDLNLILLVDFDGNGKNPFETSLQAKLDEQYRGDLRLEYNETSENPHFVFFSVDVIIQNTNSGSFDLIAFKQSLEDITHIQDSNQRENWRRKIKYYLTNCPSVVSDVKETIGFNA
ncbi:MULTISPECIES: hypothetical protein [Halorubrum]|uniref:hypothetical protein n=1 Tax=Halorubrum TaxID=56688 RepID=UPI0010F8C817|nr:MULTISPECIES: hypothetical protein [Halorubrum]TKX67997.1 hypothetical protein EXE40_13785 [Halorubrum sp. GN11GM_10-3_MGM]